MCKSPWPPLTRPKHRRILQAFSNVKVVCCRKEDITIWSVLRHVNNNIMYWIVDHNSTCSHFNAVHIDKFCWLYKRFGQVRKQTLWFVKGLVKDLPWLVNTCDVPDDVLVSWDRRPLGGTSGMQVRRSWHLLHLFIIVSLTSIHPTTTTTTTSPPP